MIDTGLPIKTEQGEEGKAEKPMWPRPVALEVTRELLPYLQPFCRRLIVAGSLRRKRQMVGDIEIVYIPRSIAWPDPEDLLGQEIEINVVDHALSLLIRAGVIEKRLNVNGAPMWGPENKLGRHRESGIPIDFFATSEESWWNYVVCRTGGRLSNTEIATVAKERGWKWHPYGSGFERMSGPEKGTLRTMHSEQDVFEFVGLPYLAPEDRK